MHQAAAGLILFPMNACPFALIALFAAATASVASEAAPRERLSLDAGWRFHLGNEWGSGQSLAKAGTGLGPAGEWYSVASWRRVDLPHDWAIELPFDPKADGSHGFKPVGDGFPQNNVGWYRRTLELSKEDSGRRIWLEFDGAYRDCTVFVNGWFVAHNESGYSGFRCDITDVARCGASNFVAVRVDASQPEGWFYEGAGIYRHVWLVKTSPVALAPDGVLVRTRFKDNVPAGPAGIELEARLLDKAGGAGACEVAWDIYSPEGKIVATASAPAPTSDSEIRVAAATAAVNVPILWSPETPRLYRLVTTVSAAGRVIDRTETVFGIRTVGFDPDRGFLLNGAPLRPQGNLEPPGSRRGGLGAPRQAAILPHRPAEGDGMQCLPLDAQPADARAPGRMRPAGDARHGREQAGGFRRAAPGAPRGARAS